MPLTPQDAFARNVTARFLKLIETEIGAVERLHDGHVTEWKVGHENTTVFAFSCHTCRAVVSWSLGRRYRE